MRRNAIITLMLMLACSLGVSAQAPNNTGDYYKKANGYKGSVLKTKLCKIIYKSSNPGYDALLAMYHKSDKRPDGYLRDWYSDTTHYVIGGPKENHSYDAEGQSYNREHTVPQSWFSKQSPMKSDGHHVVPTDGYVNNRRGNYPYGEVDPNNITYQSANGYCKLGRCKTEGYTGQVFEPDDGIKGDLARIYFYMATCYENKISSWNSNAEASHVFNGTKYPGFTDWQLKMLMRWAKLDPVDSVEIARNDSVYKHQDNRNPFVDYPGLEEYIWGEKMDVGFNYEAYNSGIEPEPYQDGEDDPDDPDDPDNPDDPDDPIIIDGDALFVETFDGCAGTGGNDNTWSGGAGSGSFVSDHSGWDAAYMAGGNECARFGSGSKKGTLTSPEIAIDGDYVLTFKVAPWSEENCSMTVSVSEGSTVQIADTSFGPMTAQQWNTYQADISGTGSFKLVFTPSQNRFFMDEVLITKKVNYNVEEGLSQLEEIELNCSQLMQFVDSLLLVTDSLVRERDIDNNKLNGMRTEYNDLSQQINKMNYSWMMDRVFLYNKTTELMEAIQHDFADADNVNNQGLSKLYQDHTDLSFYKELLAVVEELADSLTGVLNDDDVQDLTETFEMINFLAEDVMNVKQQAEKVEENIPGYCTALDDLNSTVSLLEEKFSKLRLYYAMDLDLVQCAETRLIIENGMSEYDFQSGYVRGRIKELFIDEKQLIDDKMDSTYKLFDEAAAALDDSSRPVQECDEKRNELEQIEQELSELETTVNDAYEPTYPFVERYYGIMEMSEGITSGLEPVVDLINQAENRSDVDALVELMNSLNDDYTELLSTWEQLREDFAAFSEDYYFFSSYGYRVEAEAICEQLQSIIEWAKQCPTLIDSISSSQKTDSIIIVDSRPYCIYLIDGRKVLLRKK